MPVSAGGGTCGRLVRQTGVRAARDATTSTTRPTTSERNEMTSDPLPVTGAWHPGDPPGAPPVLHVRHRSPVRRRERRGAARCDDRLRDVGHARTPTRRTRSSSVTPGPATRTLPAGPARATRRRVGGTTSSAPASTSTPIGGSSCVPTCSVAVRVRPARPRRTPTTARRTDRGSRSSRFATWSAPRRS